MSITYNHYYYKILIYLEDYFKAIIILNYYFLI
jgi:hypothetical protein